jgi:hypothetical protein
VIEGIAIVAGVPDAVHAEEEALEIRKERLEARPEERDQEGDHEREAGVAGDGASMPLRRR